MLQAGEGMPRNGAKAIELLKTSAANGNAAAMNQLGVWIRDGVEVAKNDVEAVKWFQRAADLRNDDAYVNLGIMYRGARGGLSAGPAEALRLFRISAYLDNPWGRLNLANAIEKGSGTPADLGGPAALQIVARQDREPGADGGQAVARSSGHARQSLRPTGPGNEHGDLRS